VTPVLVLVPAPEARAEPQLWWAFALLGAVLAIALAAAFGVLGSIVDAIPLAS
jgi:hypothetical protein